MEGKKGPPHLNHQPTNVYIVRVAVLTFSLLNGLRSNTLYLLISHLQQNYRQHLTYLHHLVSEQVGHTFTTHTLVTTTILYMYRVAC